MLSIPVVILTKYYNAHTHIYRKRITYLDTEDIYQNWIKFTRCYNKALVCVRINVSRPDHKSKENL